MIQQSLTGVIANESCIRIHRRHLEKVQKSRNIKHQILINNMALKN